MFFWGLEPAGARSGPGWFWFVFGRLPPSQRAFTFGLCLVRLPLPKCTFTCGLCVPFPAVNSIGSGISQLRVLTRHLLCLYLPILMHKRLNASFVQFADFVHCRL